MALPRQVLSDRVSRVLYRISLYFLLMFTFLFVLVTPADMIVQAIRNRQDYKVIIVGTTFVNICVVGLILYASRLYDVRMALADVPKRYVPGQEHDLPRSSAVLIEHELRRCSMIRAQIEQPAEWVSHPGLPPPPAPSTKNTTHYANNVNSDDNNNNNKNTTISTASKFDFPEVPYVEVLIESARLLEEKANSLHLWLPGHRRNAGLRQEQQREQGAKQPGKDNPINSGSGGMSFRDYVAELSNHVQLDTDLAARFVQGYERARFSGISLTEWEFKELMRTFMGLIRSIELPFQEQPETLVI
ncbi:hypothetical protein V1514DRAFT_333240 [Lipomyces japonicus]|uniref:uncharacterized protein n=1 Tax=Lipomyces japonicus TaxID=56871 RepID=UPI0034CEB5E1